MVGETHLRVADDREARKLWPAVRAAQLFEDREEYEAFRAGGPWRVLSDGAGAAAVIERWRDHLDILAIKGLWVHPAHVTEAVRSIMQLAGRQGFQQLLSPLVTEDAAGPYRDAGCLVRQRIVVLRSRTQDLRRHAHTTLPPPDVEIRLARTSDAGRLAGLDARCFDDFWRYEPERIGERLSGGRVSIAECETGLIGYTHATIHRGTGTIGRLAVAPEHRRRGVAAAMLQDIIEYCDRSGASEVSLCTQQDNMASRALYASAGFSEMPGRLLFLIGEISTGD